MSVLVTMPLAVQAQTTASCPGGSCSINNPLASTSICGLLKNIIQSAVEILIPIAVLFLILSGLMFVIAQGDVKKLKTAKRNFYYTVIGIAILVGAWTLALVIAATVNAIGGSNIISCR